MSNGNNEAIKNMRLKIVNQIHEESDFNGWQIVDASGLEHDGTDHFSRVYFVENDELKNGPTLKKILSVTFEPNSSDVLFAAFDGRALKDIGRFKA